MTRHSNQIREELSALLDGELGEERARALRRMLDEDPSLRAEWEQLRKTSELVRKAPLEKAPESLRQGVLAGVAPAGRIHRLPRILAIWGVAAAALVAVGLFLHFQPEASAPGGKDTYVAESGAKDSRANEGADRKRTSAARSTPGVAEQARTHTRPQASLEKDAGAAEPKASVLQDKVGTESSKKAGETVSALFLSRVERQAKVPAAPESRIVYLAALSGKSRNDVQHHIALVVRGAVLRETAETARSANGAAGKAGVRGYSGASAPGGPPVPTAPPEAPAPPAAKAKGAGQARGSTAGLAFGGGSPPLVVHASSKKEAELLRSVLLRAYAPAPEGPVTFTAERASKPPAARDRSLDLRLDLSPGKAVEVKTWLALLTRKPAAAVDALSREDREALRRAETSLEQAPSGQKGDGAKEAAQPSAGAAKPPPKESLAIRIDYPR